VLPYTGPNIGTFLEPFGRADLLEYMNTFWIAQNQDNAGFWGHEMSKHGYCFSTFNVPCYGPQYREHEEVVDFFETAIKYYQRFPTYKWLKAKDIVPSNSTTYSYTAIRDVLAKKHGGVPFLGCSGPRFNATEAGKGSTDNGYTVLSEVWYYEHVSTLFSLLPLSYTPRDSNTHIQVYGRTQEGRTVSVDASPTYLTNCAMTKGAIHYYQRSNGSEKAPAVPYKG
jgi:ribonuclease T2